MCVCPRRSTDNEDTTKRKVNLVFEKIQTLKSRAAGSDNKVRHCCGVVVIKLNKQRNKQPLILALGQKLSLGEQHTTHQAVFTYH